MEKLFNETIKFMDSYSDGLELGMPTCWLNKVEKKIEINYEKIKKAGMVEEFEDYCLD